MKKAMPQHTLIIAETINIKKSETIVHLYTIDVPINLRNT